MAYSSEAALSILNRYLEGLAGDLFTSKGKKSLKNPCYMPIPHAAMKRPVRNNRGKRGQTLVEYALILAFISVVAISVLLRLGAEVKEIFTTITSQLAVAGSSH
jgi:Flp pilus assembly pilin Flp